MIHDLNSPAARLPARAGIPDYRSPGSGPARGAVALSPEGQLPQDADGGTVHARTSGLLGPVDESCTSVSQAPWTTPWAASVPVLIAQSPTPVFMKCGRLSCSMVDHQDEPLTDAGLVAAAPKKPGSGAAVDELYQRHREPVLSYGYICCHGPRSTVASMRSCYGAVPLRCVVDGRAPASGTPSYTSVNSWE